jgi:hypothetical protein
MMFRLRTFWKTHQPGEIIDATLDEVWALVCSGYAEIVQDAQTAVHTAELDLQYAIHAAEAEGMPPVESEAPHVEPDSADHTS